MTHFFPTSGKSCLWMALLMIVFADPALGQTTGSISLNGGTLTYSVVSFKVSCEPPPLASTAQVSTINGTGYTIWDFDQFVFTDGTGVSYSLSGSASFIQSSGGSTCPPSGGNMVILTGPSFIITVQPGPGTLTAAFTATAFSVPTYHYDNLRTGGNTHETVLTPSNVSSAVNPNQFGRLFSHILDAAVYAQPLYVAHLSITGGTHNVVFVATDSDSVYAFDADNNTGANANPLWHASLVDTAHGANSGEKPADAGGGIKSTPVIDLGTNTMYVEVKSQLNSTYFHRLHALDIFTGNEKSPGPALITGSVPGIGGGGTTVNFNDVIKNQMNRSGLLLVSGTIYIGFASDGQDFEFGQYYGWVLAYDEATLTQKAANTSVSSNGSNNGILWAAEAIDASGNSPSSMILNAYDATNGNRLYRSSDNSARDNAGGSVHFVAPIVANGKVYLGGTQLSVFGQNPPPGP